MAKCQGVTHLMNDNMERIHPDHITLCYITYGSGPCRDHFPGASWQCSIQAMTCSVERISLDLQDLSTRIPPGTDQHIGPSESPNYKSRESHASLIRSIYWNMINEGHNLKLRILQCAPARCLTDQTLFSLETQLAFSSAGCCYVKSILNLNLPCILHN